MANNEKDMVRELKRRGLTCARLERKIKEQIKDGAEFRKLGFNRLAQTEEAVANELRKLKKKVCLLR